MSVLKSDSMKYIKYLAFLICYIIYPFSFLFPRSRKKYVFGSFRSSFNDNARYLFIHANETEKDVKCIWLSLRPGCVRQVRSLGFRAYCILSPLGVWHALTARYWFFNSYTSDIMFCLSGGAVCVNLWHGVGLKRIEFNVLSGPMLDRFSKKNKMDVFTHPESFRRPDWLLTSTPFQTVMFAKAFRVPESRCLELGYPRNWILTTTEQQRTAFINRSEPQETARMIEKFRKYDKVYVYMPTWRDSQRNIFTQSMDLNRLNDIMVSQNALLVLKPHANVILTQDIEQLSNVILTGIRLDIYPMLPYADVLITDYSSILYDWLLMKDKDVILYLYDYDSYVKERDFYYPYMENVAGRIVNSFDQLCDCLSSGDYTMDPNKRDMIVAKFWGETAGYDSSQKILDFIRQSSQK